MTARVLVLALCLAVLWGARGAEPHLAIVGGLGGEDYYSDLFHRWVETLDEVATQRLGIAPEHLIRLEEDPSQAADAGADVSRKENVLGAIRRLAETSAPGDVIALVLLGHGTARGDRALFNLPGPDLSATELAGALDALAGRTVVVVVAAPASAPFVAALSGADRIIITATATAAENQHTRFGGHFVDALAEDAADSDKDRRVSMLEAFRYATAEVARAFETERRLRTEHAMLDDDGDGAGSRDPGTGGGDGSLAARVHLAAPAHRPDTAAGREALALEIEARRLVDRIEALKREKRTMESADYLQRLESLFIELALNRRAYREIE
ncbi:MAG: hypothetical protein GWN84_05450 [Gammaproteobacteria bacterium]|nr:hypothetical protein [Gammaproteobacteria bacterium]NIR82413.1 hypothetical protein [Gammaproteobacteria bacterium]NIR91994.1 hypothetical protein [Gammaproteobacteria bacterium]NIU03550.1 hypothetical protein [Gammaproteobacteria bacterium]NIX84824.1 hypothetical protein [Gammaproteobacteria bacterium]